METKLSCALESNDISPTLDYNDLNYPLRFSQISDTIHLISKAKKRLNKYYNSLQYILVRDDLNQ